MVEKAERRRPEPEPDPPSPGPYPQVGAVVDHFAFGPAEVVRANETRLALRTKDGRIREIAIGRLTVTELPPDGEGKRFLLDRLH